MTMRIAAGVIALLALGTALPAAAQVPKIGQLEIKAYQAIPKTKTAVQLTSDSALGRNLRREVMIRLARRGNEVGFSGGNVMRMDVQYVDLLGSSGITRGPVGGRDQNFDGPAANPPARSPRHPHRAWRSGTDVRRPDPAHHADALLHGRRQGAVDGDGVLLHPGQHGRKRRHAHDRQHLQRG
jgi:hypothetical protein